MLWLPTCHFVSHLLQHVPMTAVILLGFLFHVIQQPAPVPILQQSFIFLFTHFQTVIPSTDLSLSPLTSLVDHFSSLFPHIQVHVSSAFASASFLYQNIMPQKGGNLEETGTLFIILKAQHYRRCEKLKTVQWGQNWCCLAFKTETVSADPI